MARWTKFEITFLILMDFIFVMGVIFLSKGLEVQLDNPNFLLIVGIIFILYSSLFKVMANNIR